jgi:outer membrane protein OmpA-like peptidoglycan-associated protein
MIHRIGGSLNLGTGIVSTLLVAAAGLVTSALRKVSRASGGLDARGLSALLMDRGVARAPSTYVRARPVYESRPVERTARRQGGLLWLLALVPLAILAIWFFARPHEIKERVLTNPTAQVEPTPAPVPSPVPDKHDPASITTTEPAPAPVTATTEPTPAPADTTTPAAPAAETTASLDLPSGSPEAMLMSQAETPASSNDWIDLDAVKFPTDSAEVPAEAKGQIEHVAEIMKAKPDLTIAIAGHTSTTGTKEHNMQLSEERAEAVRKVLVDDGIDQSRVQTSGLADENKAVDTTNEEAANRRISARVVNAVPEG